MNNPCADRRLRARGSRAALSICIAALLIPFVAACTADPGPPAADPPPAVGAPPTAPLATAGDGGASDTGVANPSGDAETDPRFADLVGFCRDATVSGHPQLGRTLMNTLGARIQDHASGRSPLSSEVLMKAYVDYGLQSIEHGEVDQALSALAELREFADDPEAIASADLLTGIAHMRAAEAENCLADGGGELCLLGRGPEGLYARPEHSREAIAAFIRYLEAKPDILVAQWQLNLAAITIGVHPEGVPERFRVPVEALASEHELPRMVDRARELGLASVNLLGGAVMEDFDGDGYLDLFATSYDPCVPAQLFRNARDGTFVDASVEAGLELQLGGFNVQQTDFDNDGRMDLFITRGAWQFDFGRQRNSLLRNLGDGRFEDVTHAAGLAQKALPTQASAWADFDGDGFLDLFIGNETDSQNVAFPSELYRNNGDGTFTDVAVQAGVTNDRMAKGAAWGDYDNDGDPDLYVSNIGPNRLYRNNGDGTFTDVAPELRVIEPAMRSFAPWFFDYDNDGWLDLFVAGYDAGTDGVIADLLGRAAAGARPRLYRNLGQGAFEDVTTAMGLDRVLLPMGSNFGDIDSDGWLDIYLATGSPDPLASMPNVLLWNDGGRRFLDAGASAGVDHLGKGHGVAWGDIDNDGDEDIYVQVGGFVPGDPGPNALYENPGNDNAWVTLRIEGETSNRPAIGARVEVVTSGPSGRRSIHREVTTGSSFGANSLRLEIGLGDATAIEDVTVRFPSGWVQHVGGVEPGGFYDIVEGRDEPVEIELEPIRLGGGQGARSEVAGGDGGGPGSVASESDGRGPGSEVGGGDGLGPRLEVEGSDGGA